MQSSRVAELAREEAARAEAEDDTDGDELEAEGDDTEDEDGDDAEQETDSPSADAELAYDKGAQPPAAPQIGPKEVERLERARDAQKRKLAGIIGDEMVEHECLFCSGLGFGPQAPPPGAVATIVADEDGYRVEWSGPLELPNLRRAPDKAMCDECDGEGEVLSGSKNPHAAVVGCSKCGGNGWVTVAREQPTAPAFTVTMPGTAPGNGVQTPHVQQDTWGRESGHVHFGIPPQLITG